MTPHGHRPQFRLWAWLCPLLAVAAAAGILVAFGWRVWSALLSALLLACPVLIVWGMIATPRDRPAAHRRGR